MKKQGERPMTVPLPGGYADKLMTHLGQCEVCRASKTNPTLMKCPEGRALVRSTLEERHERPNR